MSYDLGYIDLEQRTLQTIENPISLETAFSKVVEMAAVLGDVISTETVKKACVQHKDFILNEYRSAGIAQYATKQFQRSP